MNEHSLRVLEWAKILERLADNTNFSLGKKKALELKPSNKISEVQKNLTITSEALRQYWRNGDPPFGGASDISDIINRVRIGGILEPEQFLRLHGTLRCSGQMHSYLENAGENLQAFRDNLSKFKELLAEIDRCIDEEGMVKDSASSTLRSLRQKKLALASKVRQKINSIVQATENQKYLQDAIVTFRNSRYVVPVKQEYRSKIPGIVHDQSASGATLFIEPAAIVEFNNELALVEKEEQREIERILTELTLRVRAEIAEVKLALETLAELDFVFAKAKLSRQLDANEAKINKQGRINIKQGRHPILKGDVVPISVWLGDEFKVLVITGPNTGGKTVTLKTIGLFCLMTQSGLHIPAQSGSEIAVFDSIYADIGDEQSIEQSLSTFSSHMSNIVNILNEASSNSLVLLDELGAGTDPTEGAALAQAILEFLRERQIVTAATTHYSELKHYAYNTENVQNASVDFDVTTLKPTYNLSIGLPGKSNAFAIASRLGLNEAIINTARSLLTEEQVKMEDILAEIDANRKEAIEARRLAEQRLESYTNLKEKYEQDLAELHEQKENILEQARLEAEEYVKKAKREMDILIGELRKAKGDELEGSIKDSQERVKILQTSLAKKEDKRSIKKKIPKFKLGENVRIKSLRQEGYILQISDDYKEALVQAGIMKVTIKLEDLEKVAEEIAAPKRRIAVKQLSKADTIKAELDIRGKTVEEGLLLIDKYLDDAFLSSLKKVWIIHGKGTGALREAIAVHLKCQPLVKSFKLGEHGEGGSGVTVVELNVD